MLTTLSFLLCCSSLISFTLLGRSVLQPRNEPLVPPLPLTHSPPCLQQLPFTLATQKLPTTCFQLPNTTTCPVDAHSQGLAVECNRLPARCARCKYWEAGLNI